MTVEGVKGALSSVCGTKEDIKWCWWARAGGGGGVQGLALSWQEVCGAALHIHPCDVEGYLALANTAPSAKKHTAKYRMLAYIATKVCVCPYL
jgi:hypothetical protein